MDKYFKYVVNLKIQEGSETNDGKGKVKII